ncbi:MAG: isoprenyl transferase [Peptococcaceae bacterium]|jgi:undecaprenyl diphosphate synthase|nr:isoprenyl transferase [Peptococcaceae bacterium]
MWPWQSKKIDEEETELNQDRIPAHVAIIMDGNGRWAKKRGLPRALGHRAGVEALRDIVQECSRLEIKVLTVFAFSTENWRRPKEEVNILMALLTEYLKGELKELHDNQVIVRMSGVMDELPLDAQSELKKAIAQTRDNQGLILNLALNYGGRAELIQAIRQVSAEVLKNNLKIEEINEDIVNSYLYTAGLPDPDLIIRTSGEHRLSNFLLWQSSYAEIVVVPEYWPEFGIETLHQAIRVYQQRDRRFGGIKDGRE